MVVRSYIGVPNRLVINKLFEWLFSRVLASRRGGSGSIPGRSSSKYGTTLACFYALHRCIGEKTLTQIPGPISEIMTNDNISVRRVLRVALGGWGLA
jgi:hypothetical protein